MNQIDFQIINMLHKQKFHNKETFGIGKDTIVWETSLTK
jgi:hypothetical protein